MQGGVSFKGVVCELGLVCGLGGGSGVVLSVGVQGLVVVDEVLSFIVVMVRYDG